MSNVNASYFKGVQIKREAVKEIRTLVKGFNFRVSKGEKMSHGELLDAIKAVLKSHRQNKVSALVSPTSGSMILSTITSRYEFDLEKISE